MRSKSILTEAKQIERAITLINLGARLQVLESETDLSYERLLRLYKEVSGKSPSKGQLPFSTDWFMTWQPNIHSSLFLNIHEYLNKSAALDEIDTVIKAYQLYQEQTQGQDQEQTEPPEAGNKVGCIHHTTCEYRQLNLLILEDDHKLGHHIGQHEERYHEPHRQDDVGRSLSLAGREVQLWTPHHHREYECSKNNTPPSYQKGRI